MMNTFAVKEIRSVISAIGANLFTKQMDDPIHVELKSVSNNSGNYQGFLGLGLVTAIFHLASILAAVYLFSFPFRDHRIREFLAAAGGSRVVLGAATILPLVVIQWMSMMAVYAYARRALAPMTFDEFIVVSAGQLAMILACSGAGAAFVGITGNMRMSTSVAGVIAGPAFAFAGQTFPVMAMPFAVRCFAFLLPLTHVLKVQSTMLLGSVGKAHAWESIVVLLFMALFWHLLASKLLLLRWKEAVACELHKSLKRDVSDTCQHHPVGRIVLIAEPDNVVARVTAHQVDGSQYVTSQLMATVNQVFKLVVNLVGRTVAI